MGETIHFNLSNDVDDNLKYEADFIINHNELLAKPAIKYEVSQFFCRNKHGNDIAWTKI